MSNIESIEKRIAEHERLLEIARENGDYAAFSKHQNEIKFFTRSVEGCGGVVIN